MDKNRIQLKAATPKEAESLLHLLPKLERAASANGTLSDDQDRGFLAGMVRRLLNLPDAQLREVLDYSSLADFYNIGLLGDKSDPRNHLRLNIYPDFPGDVAFHTHRTRVSSLILSGTLTNSMFDGNAFTPDAAGDHRIVMPTRTPGKSVLSETGRIGFQPLVTIRDHEQGAAYAIPVDHFHSVTTERNTVTLCLFREDPTGFRKALILKKLEASLMEDRPRPISPNIMELVRDALSSVIH